jgi:hypothetical protein
MAREDTPGVDPRPQPVRESVGGPVVIIVLSFAALVIAACWAVLNATRSDRHAGRRPANRLLTVDRRFPPGGRFPGDPYIGSRACAECHPGEFALHSRSGHALTLRPASRLALARRLDGTTVTDPEWPDVHWSYQLRDGQLHVSRQARDRTQDWIVDYAFGSGRHATTFVSVLDLSIPSILEHRLTYYAREGALGITPSQDVDSRIPEFTPHGNELAADHSRKCIRCHTTQMSARGGQRIDEDTMIPNVSCERCHGPSRAHVTAARRGAQEPELSLPFGPDGWTALALLKLCGECHRHPSGARPGQIRPDNPRLARFQPVGLMQSKCFMRSGGAITCITCHDPHARASSNRASYDAKCLECHGGQILAAKPANTGAAAGLVCAVSPRERCVECHMPRVDAGQNILFSDHWIRIRSEGESSLSIPTPVPNLDFPAPE